VPTKICSGVHRLSPLAYGSRRTSCVAAVASPRSGCPTFRSLQTHSGRNQRCNPRRRLCRLLNSPSERVRPASNWTRVTEFDSSSHPEVAALHPVRIVSLQFAAIRSVLFAADLGNIDPWRRRSCPRRSTRPLGCGATGGSPESEVVRARPTAGAFAASVQPSLHNEHRPTSFCSPHVAASLAPATAILLSWPEAWP
jgi:hypothetical protein